jgi:hypothetical protein
MASHPYTAMAKAFAEGGISSDDVLKAFSSMKPQAPRELEVVTTWPRRHGKTDLARSMHMNGDSFDLQAIATDKGTTYKAMWHSSLSISRPPIHGAIIKSSLDEDWAPKPVSALTATATPATNTTAVTVDSIKDWMRQVYGAIAPTKPKTLTRRPIGGKAWDRIIFDEMTDIDDAVKIRAGMPLTHQGRPLQARITDRPLEVPAAAGELVGSW